VRKRVKRLRVVCVGLAGVWIAGVGLVALGLAGVGLAGAQGRGAGWETAVRAPEVDEVQARVVVVDVGTGRLVGAARLREAARTLATPGSTLKPLILARALETGRRDAWRRVFCTRRLRVGGRQMDCAHPQTGAMDAEQALTWSCNTYFAGLAAEMGPGEVERALGEWGLLGATGLAEGESVGEFRAPRTVEETKLAALGVEGVRVTLLELASAYRRLELSLEKEPESGTARVVRAGLKDSASYGMAGAAGLGGVSVEGKTGTAAAAEGGPTHGWFVGLAPVERPQVVVAVYVPAGHGANAAAVAAAVLRRSPLRTR
jgi:cell division protein FtsI (penicillin-binding protein 3)